MIDPLAAWHEAAAVLCSNMNADDACAKPAHNFARMVDRFASYITMMWRIA
jgi:hypothetical protein